MQIRLENFSGILPKISPRLLPSNAAVVSTSTELYSGELRGLKKPAFIIAVGSTAERAFRANVHDGATPKTYADVWVTSNDETVNFYRGPNVNDSYQRHYFTGINTQPQVVSGQFIYDYNADVDHDEGTDVLLSLDALVYNSVATQELTVITASGNETLMVETAEGLTELHVTQTAVLDINIYDWGIPGPSYSTTPAITAGPGDTDLQETRSYVYTFVNEWGEESGPSLPTPPVSGGVTGDWVITGISFAFAEAGNWNPIDKIRFYRTVTGGASVNFRFVGEEDASTIAAADPVGSWVDDLSSDRASLNDKLATTFYQLPPTTTSTVEFMRGLVQLPNGVFAAFVGSDIYFSEPYMPYAWPSNYTISVGTEIIGLGVFHSGLIVCTDSNPKVVSGSSPSLMTMIDLDAHEPCLSFKSIVSTTDGVYYTSQNGIVKATEHSASVISNAYISRTEWQNRYSPKDMQGAINGQGYIGIYNPRQGVLIGAEVGNGAMVDIGNLSYIKSIQTDSRSGEIYIIRNGSLFEWNRANAPALPYSWESKTFETPYPVNFAAFKLKWTFRDFMGEEVDPIDTTYWNTYISELEWSSGDLVGLHTYNQFTLGFSRLNQRNLDSTDLDPDGVPTYRDKVPEYEGAFSGYFWGKYRPDIVKMPLGHSDLIGEASNILSTGVLVKILAKKTTDTEFSTVYSHLITDEHTHRLPSTFKADLWRVRLESDSNIHSFVMAETGRELAKK